MLICFPCYTLVSTRGAHRMRIVSQVTRSRRSFGAQRLNLGVQKWGHDHQELVFLFWETDDSMILASCVQCKCCRRHLTYHNVCNERVFGRRWLHKIACLAELMLICFACYTLVSTRGPHRMRIVSQVTRSRCSFGAQRLKLEVQKWGQDHQELVVLFEETYDSMILASCVQWKCCRRHLT